MRVIAQKGQQYGEASLVNGAWCWQERPMVADTERLAMHEAYSLGKERGLKVVNL